MPAGVLSLKLAAPARDSSGNIDEAPNERRTCGSALFPFNRTA